MACMPLEEIFRRSTDGSECPMARCYAPEEFIAMCKNAGFSKVEYQGGYPNSLEPDLAKDYIEAALQDDRLEDEHKVFLRKVRFDDEGFPVVDGIDCCIGGTYRLWG